jgi:hypothetical protein
MSFNGMDRLKPPGWKPMNITQIITDGCDCYPWHEVYAWLPVRSVTGKTLWRQKVWKRKVWVVWGTGFHMEPLVQYATLFDIINGDADILGKQL